VVNKVISLRSAHRKVFVVRVIRDGTVVVGTDECNLGGCEGRHPDVMLLLLALVCKGGQRCDDVWR
jgi:hypothetical protein